MRLHLNRRQETAMRIANNMTRNPGRGQAVRAVLLATVAYFAATAVAMWPALSDLSNTIMSIGAPSTPTTTGTWPALVFPVLPAFATHIPLMPGSNGFPGWEAAWTADLGWMLPERLLAVLAGAPGAWTLALAFGFVADGLAMFGLVRWLTRRDWIAFVAGLLYAFSPFHVAASYMHAGYVYSFIFPLILWAGLALLQRPTLRRALVFGLSLGLAGYFDGYYLLFAPLFTISIVVAGLLWAKRLGLTMSALAKQFAAAAGVALAVAAPLLIVYLADSSQVGREIGQHTLRSLTSSGTSMSMYFVPWPNSLAWGWLTHSWFLDSSRVGPPIGGWLYLGGVVLLLALAPLVVSLTLRGLPWVSETSLTWQRYPADALHSLRLPLRFLAPALIFISGILILCSFAWFGPIPGLPALIYNLRPYWLAYGGLGVAIDAVVILAAAISLAILATSRRTWLAPVLAMLAILDGTAIFPWSSWSARDLPAAYSWLALHPTSGPVAVYPLPSRLVALKVPWAFRSVVRHSLFFAHQPNLAQDQLLYGLADITDPQTIPTLRAVGVSYVVIDKALYHGIAPGKTHLKGLRRIVSTRGETLYKVEPGPVPPAALTQVLGIHSIRSYLANIERYMWGTSAELGLWLIHPGIPLRISFDATSWLRPRQVEVRQGSVIRWQGTVGTKTIKIIFNTTSDAPLHIHSAPGVIVYPNYYHRTLDLTSFDVRRA
jgi:hypothetical protein